MLITEILRQNADLYRDETALVAVNSRNLIPGNDESYQSCRQELSWGQFNRYANQVANYYGSLGIGRGNRVGILLVNCIQWLPIYFGILKSGAMAVPLNFRFDAKETITSIEHVDVDALVFDERCRPTVEAIKEQMTCIRSFIFVGDEKARPLFAQPCQNIYHLCSDGEPDVKLSADDDAAIYFSSGTTGVPKAVVYTHSILEAACVREQKIHGQVHSDVFLCIPPLYHIGAKLHWTGNLLKGAKGVLLLGFTVPAFFEVMSREQITIAFLLLPWIQDILLALDTATIKLGNYDLSRWQLLHMGAQPIPPAVVERLQTKLPFLSYDISYGLSEAGGPGCLNLGSENINRAGSIGRPAELWEAKVVDGSGVDIEPGEPGELLIRGPGIMRCYYKNEDATRAALEGGWLHTGDVAKQDADGFYYLIGRKKEIIISGGENISPTQIENYLREVDGVMDAAAFGIPHNRLGEVVAAVVMMKPGCSLNEEVLTEHCSILPKYKQPQKYFFGKVPRNATGKIDRILLKKMYMDLS